MNSADFWYTLEAGQPVRDLPQMLARVVDDRDVARIVGELRAQGYTVQRVVFHVTCDACRGHGRIGKRPKRIRRRHVPGWMMTYTDCPACDARGYTSEHEVTL